MSNGWIKIHRKITDWEWYDDIKTFKLFIHLLVSANHKTKRYRGQIINAGEVMTGQELLAKETKLSRQSIRTCLEHLKSTNEITIKSSVQGSIIQIVNYKKYQLTTNEITNDQPTINQRSTTNKNIKNEKNIPSREDFINYALSKDSTLDTNAVGLKFDAWVLAGWENGNGRKIKNWKSSLNNTIPYLPKKNNKTVIR